MTSSNLMPRISPSMRSDWRTCPKKVFFRHIAAIGRVDGRRAFAVGKAYHAGLEAWRLDPVRDAMAAGLTAASAYRNFAREEKIGYDEHTSLQVLAYVVGYATRFGLTDVGSTMVEQIVFEDGDAEVGFADCVIDYGDGRVFVVEDKTTARFVDDTPMAWSLRMNDQIATYVSALRAQGKPVAGAIYRQVKKTLTYPKKNESIEEYGDRVLEMYTTDQTNYREFVVTWGEIELRRRDKERERTNLEIVGWLDRTDVDEWPYNPSSCIGAYGPCDYIRLCANNCDASSREFQPNGKDPIDGGSYQRKIWLNEDGLGTDEGGNTANPNALPTLNPGV